MINKQHMIKIVAVFALVMALYTLRPMPEYNLYARTAAGMYEQDPAADQQTLSVLFQQTAVLDEALNSAMTLLELRTLPQQAKVQLSHYLLEISTVSADMKQQLTKQFGELRLSEMVNLPIWATETLALVQVIKQTPNQYAPNVLTDSKLRSLQGDLQWAEQTLADLKILILKALPASKRSTHPSIPLN